MSTDFHSLNVCYFIDKLDDNAIVLASQLQVNLLHLPCLGEDGPSRLCIADVCITGLGLSHTPALPSGFEINS